MHYYICAIDSSGFHIRLNFTSSPLEYAIDLKTVNLSFSISRKRRISVDLPSIFDENTCRLERSDQYINSPYNVKQTGNEN